MVEIVTVESYPDGATMASFSLGKVTLAQGRVMAEHMATMGSIIADGLVTMEEAAQLLALAYPDLAGHPQLASVMQAADEAVKALRNDGKISLLEATTIMLALLSGVPSLSDLGGAARALAARLLSLRKAK